MVSRVSHTAISIGALFSILLNVPPLFTLKKHAIFIRPGLGDTPLRRQTQRLFWRGPESSRARVSSDLKVVTWYVKIDGNMGKKQCKESHFVRPGMGKPRVRFHLTGRQTAPLIDAGRG